MGLRISTNVASLAAQRHLARNEGRSSHAMRALASGQRIVQAGDDAAGFAISEHLRGQARSLEQARQNADRAIGLVQVAEGGLNEQNNILVRLRELGIQAASDTVGEAEREYLDIEFQQLVQELDRIAVTTKYGNKSLLAGGDDSLEFQLGTSNSEADVILYRFDVDTRASAMGVSGLSVASQGDARAVLADVDDAMQRMASARAKFGSVQSRLEIARNNLDIQRENIVAARSRIADADVAHEVSEMVAGQVQQDLGVAVLAAANQSPQRALKLL